ncbi:MAG: glycoside hydrolase family 2 TIM barrel-domain containing protein [Bacteroidota bacterium]
MNLTKRFPKSLCLLCFPLFVSTAGIKAQPTRKIINIDKDWKFTLGDVTDGQQPNFDDSKWRKLDVPHDWGIEGKYDSLSITKRGGGYLPAGIGWYRKQLIVPTTYTGKRVYIEFDGIMSNSDVWVNGHLLGHRPFGYVPILYDITDWLNLGKPNIIAVRADNTEQPASRWYAGAGIYRHVTLNIVDPVHLDRWGVFIHTPEITKQNARVTIEASVTNQSKKPGQLMVQTTITSPSGKQLKSKPTALTVEAGQTAKTEQTIMVPHPELWDIETPNIYKASTIVTLNNKIIDDQENTFGIRDARFEAETGFWLNGKNIKILGACVHPDGGAVGMAVPMSVWERRIQRLKEVGCNAVRGAHCPMQKEFYDLCDRSGILMMDEAFDTWTAAKPNGQKAYNLYFNEWWEADTRAQVIRARNHPSVIIYSLGNEIRDDLNSEKGRQRFLDIRRVTKEVDSTRPVTMALFNPVRMKLFENGFSELLDVIGQNYGEAGLLAVRKGRPERKIIGTENTPSRSAWLAMRDNPAMSGEFIWTGIEYLGEADWPKISWNTALFDRNAGWKPLAWERQSWWTQKPMVHIVRNEDTGRGLTDDWTKWSDTVKKINATVYSNCEEVELYLKGVSLGKQPVPADDGPNKWVVDYAPGTIKVIGRNGSKDVAIHQHITAGAPAKLILKAEQHEIGNDWEDVVYVNATVVDKDGIRCPNGAAKIKFTLSGPGEIISVDNSDPYSHEMYKGDERTVFKGKALVIIRAKANAGTIRITASSAGLESSTTEVKIKGRK